MVGREACVIVVAHGSGRPEHSRLVESVVRYAESLSGVKALIAYLEGREHGLQGIPEVVREAVKGGCRELVITPFFLTPRQARS